MGKKRVLHTECVYYIVYSKGVWCVPKEHAPPCFFFCQKAPQFLPSLPKRKPTSNVTKKPPSKAWDFFFWSDLGRFFCKIRGFFGKK